MVAGMHRIRKALFSVVLGFLRKVLGANHLQMLRVEYIIDHASENIPALGIRRFVLLLDERRSESRQAVLNFVVYLNHPFEIVLWLLRPFESGSLAELNESNDIAFGERIGVASHDNRFVRSGSFLESLKQQRQLIIFYPFERGIPKQVGGSDVKGPPGG